MNVRVIPRAVLDSYLKVARLPLDTAARLVPGGGNGRGASARLAVDRVDATARSVAGAILRDPKLREDAKRRRAAAQERERAVKLRGRADEKISQAQARVEERHEKAQRRRAQADSRTKTRRQRASQEHQQKTEQARATEKRRREAAREVKSEQDERVDEVAPQARLEALEAKAEAEAKREEAVIEKDEAQRLGDAAAALKEERKQDADR